MEGRFVIILSLIALGNALQINLNLNPGHTAIDYNLHEEVLDAEKCEAQLDAVQSNPLLFLQFADAGLRLPRGITEFNFLDLGNYHQCLGINHNTGDDLIEGKYCRINVPLSQNLSLPLQSDPTLFDLTGIDEMIAFDNESLAKAKKYYTRRAGIMTLLGMHDDESMSKAALEPLLSMITLDMAICIPRVCSTEQAINLLGNNISNTGLTYTDLYCRLPDDKPWAPADTVATVIFSIIGLLTILSTVYDLTYTFWFKSDHKRVNPLLTSFSVYTNGRRLNSFSSAPGMLRCVDGIRALSMAWVVLAHTFVTEPAIANMLDILEWTQSISSAWITAGVYAVDTFFCLSGIVLVYTTADKITGGALLKNLPVFYLNRLLRLWPILALVILLQVSYFNRVYDGPVWTNVEELTNACRSNWWLSLLFVQNFINGHEICMSHSWYMAIDFHCYALSPLVLYWVLGRSRKSAWIALTGSLLAVLAGATTYNFINNFSSGIFLADLNDTASYMENYYRSTLARASPFFVGMIGGYVLHLYRGKELDISWMTAASLWIVSATVTTTLFFYPAIIADVEWDQPFVDGFMNSFMRPAWAAAICWIIVACQHGYGGPVNWFLTLDIWRLPARLAYAVYIMHYPMMFVINAALSLAPIKFTVASFAFKSLAHMSFSLAVGYLVTLTVDAPCSTLSKLLLGGNKKRPDPAKMAKTEH